MPSKAAPASLRRSAAGTCSLGRKHDRIQNSAAAPAMRQLVTSRGVTTPDAITSFATGDISPHMRLAPNMAT
jgi:hypothetical protein